MKMRIQFFFDVEIHQVANPCNFIDANQI